MKSYRSPKTGIRNSDTHGRGLFALAPISRGEVVSVKGGHIIDRAELKRNAEVIGASDLQISDELFMAPRTIEEHDDVMMFLNHSCEPNVGPEGNIVFVSMRDIEEGEELTVDYAMVDDDDLSMDCSCGERACRRIVTGRDWKNPELQRKYGRHFAAYIYTKILSAGRQ